ncbi:MAG: hypothetical protein ACK41E_09880 [Deinococcales bacterium]
MNFINYSQWLQSAQQNVDEYRKQAARDALKAPATWRLSLSKANKTKTGQPSQSKPSCAT